jgi:predicted ATPase/DNA-binding winged helix-turn-helix (wHTH) protein
LQVVYRFGSLELWPQRRLLMSAGQAVSLGARAFDVMMALVTHRHRLVTKSELLDLVWPGLVVEEANIHVQISHLRKALGATAIATVPGQGYRFAMPVEGDDPRDPVPDRLPASGRPEIPRAGDILLGRGEELGLAQELLLASGLVTVLGPGGIGKTRLAQQLALALEDRFEDGASWVDVAALTDERHIAAAIAHATGVQTGADEDVLVQVLNGLEGRHLLLVLDSCEHLVEPVSHWVEQLRAAAKGVSLLVTSQSALKTALGETFRLGPLQLPAAAASLERCREAAAVQLFIRRARAVDRRFDISPSSMADVAELVSRLDGNPLAIEMAAARVPLLGAKHLNDRLNERFEMLRNVNRSGVPRQHSLRATLDWSFTLLEELERPALECLAVFAGTFRVDVGQRALSSLGAVDEWELLDIFSALVDKSLVHLDTLDPPRYRLLETVRLFGQDRLRQQGRTAVAERGHRDALIELAREVECAFWTMQDAAWLARYSPDYPDLVLAFERAHSSLDADGAALTGNALMRLDHLRNDTASRRRRAQALHELLPHAGDEATAWIWNCISSHGLIASSLLPPFDAAQKAVAAWRRVHHLPQLYFSIGFLAWEHARRHEFERAEQLLLEAKALERSDWPMRRRMWTASVQAGICIYRGDGPGYRDACQRELVMALQAGASRAAAWAQLKLADAALMAQDLTEAIRLGQAAVELLRQLDQPSNLGLALSNLCAAHLLSGNVEMARAIAREAFDPLWRAGWGHLLLDSLACIAAEEGRFDEAARLLGCCDAWYARQHDVRQPNEASIADRAASRVLKTVPEEVFSLARSQAQDHTELEVRSIAWTSAFGPGGSSP